MKEREWHIRADHWSPDIMRAIRENRQLAMAEAWEEGAAAMAREHQIQRNDPTHPITRDNPYRSEP